MRYLRMLTNAVLGGALGAAYLTVITLQINPRFPLRVDTVQPLAATLALFYGAHLAVAFYLVMVLRELVAEVMSPGWLSLRLLAWLAAGASATSAALMWLNLGEFSVTLGDEAARRMALGAAATSASAIVLLAIAVVYYSFRWRGGRVGVTLFVATVAASLVLPLAARGVGRPLAPVAQRQDSAGDVSPAELVPRVTMLLLDGASLDYISPAVAEGKLPNFGKILDEGGALHLTTLRPTQPGPVWTAAATGKYAPKNGVRSAAAYSVGPSGELLELLPDYCFSHGLVYFGFVREVPHTSASLRARPLWEIINDSGLSVGVVGWPLTYPARPVRGYMVSERFHLAAGSPLELDTQLVYPAGLMSLARTRPASGGAQLAEVAAVAVDPVPQRSLDADLAAAPTGRDATFRLVASEVERRGGSQLMAVRYQGLDVVGHYFLRHALPRTFGDVSDEERRQFGHVLDRYYVFIDSEIGAAMASMGANDLLLVVSGFGMEPVTLPKRLFAMIMRDPDVSGTHERAPDGFMLAYGSAVAPGRLSRGAIVDVTPTVLYFLGLPIGRDMDGHARTDLFKRTFTSTRPITFIPTHER